MDHKKARGVDQINNNLIHKTAEVVAEPLCKLINCSIETGMFPDLWKHARVLPLHKYGCQIIIDLFLFFVHYLKLLKNMCMGPFLIISLHIILSLLFSLVL